MMDAEEKEEERKFIEEYIDIDELDVFRSTRGKIPISPILNLVSFYDSRNKKIVGNRVDKELEKAVSFPGVAVDAIVTVTAGVWEIAEISVMLLADINAANRVLTVDASQTLDTLATNIFAPSTLTATAGQLVGYVINDGFAPNLLTHDNGVLAIVANENPLPLRMEEGDSISATYTNKQVGDLVEMIVRYKDVT